MTLPASRAAQRVQEMTAGEGEEVSRLQLTTGRI